MFETLQDPGIRPPSDCKGCKLVQSLNSDGQNHSMCRNRSLAMNYNTQVTSAAPSCWTSDVPPRSPAPLQTLPAPRIPGRLGFGLVAIAVLRRLLVPRLLLRLRLLLLLLLLLLLVFLLFLLLLLLRLCSATLLLSCYCSATDTPTVTAGCGYGYRGGYGCCCWSGGGFGVAVATATATLAMSYCPSYDCHYPASCCGYCATTHIAPKAVETRDLLTGCPSHGVPKQRSPACCLRSRPWFLRVAWLAA